MDDIFDYDNMDLDQLNDALVKLLKHKMVLEQGKKDYMGSFKEQLNEVKARVENIVGLIDVKRSGG
jgi:hypothetical protein